MMWLTTLLAALSLVSVNVQAASPRGPIIGVFAHPFARHGEYIAASYVKWVESAGGRVVPIPYTAPKEYLKELVPQLNGLLFPGGAASVNDRAEYMYQLAIELNDAGVHYPVWGTCLGFEWLLQLTAADLDAVQGGFDSMNISLALNYTEDARPSRLFSQASDELFQWIGERPLTMNNHMQGISTEHFEQNSNLTNFYTVLSTNVDRKGREFVSVIEAKKYPIFAVQFHPEKNNFEYGEYDDGTPYEVIDHSYEAVLMSQYFANFFVNEARKNDFQFKDPKVEQAALIYNYQTFTVKYPGFVESYVFKHDDKQEFWSIL